MERDMGGLGAEEMVVVEIVVAHNNIRQIGL